MQASLFPSAGERATPVEPERVVRELRQRIEKEVDALALQIDVPDIRTYTNPKIVFTPFQPQPSSDFALVEQRLRSADLKTGEQELGETVELQEVDEPVKYLAAHLLDEVEEFDAVDDKQRILQLANDYLAATRKSGEELKKLVHQYSFVMIRDLRDQVLAHLYDETEVTFEVRAGFVVFRPYAKSIRMVGGELDLREPLDNKSQIRQFLFRGVTKSVINRIAFDSDPERRFAIALEDDPAVLKWLRPPVGQMPIFYRGSTYNVDFIVETGTHRYLIEVKAHNELGTDEVMEKARAAMRWCEIATEKQGGKPWSYQLVPDDAVSPGSTLQFMLSQAVKLT